MPDDLVTDVDRFNQASVDARRHLPWAGTCWEVQHAHAALHQAIAAIIQAEVPAPGYLPWMDGCIADYAVHTAQLRRWLPDDHAGG